MTRKETALEALNKKIPKLEEKIDQDKKLLEELKTKREVLEVEALRKFLHDNGMTTEGGFSCGTRTKDRNGGQKKCGTLKNRSQQYFLQWL